MKVITACREALKSIYADVRFSNRENTSADITDNSKFALLRRIDAILLVATGLIAAIVVIQVVAVITL